MRIREGDPLEIFTDKDGELIFKKYSPIGELSDFAAQICDSLRKATDGIVAVSDRDSVIAAIPIGYADGLNRRLGNRHAYCLVNGQKADYVGNICMDVAMIDVTDIPCKEGDSVEIFGEHLPVQTLSDILETIPYEVLTTISNRVKRVYFQD